MNDRMVIHTVRMHSCIIHTHRALRDRVLKIRVGATDPVVVRPEAVSVTRPSREPGAESGVRSAGTIVALADK